MGGYRAPSHRGGFAFAGLNNSTALQVSSSRKVSGKGNHCHRLGCPMGMVSASRVGVSHQKVSVFLAWSHLKKTSIIGKERESDARSPVQSIPNYSFTFLTAENRVAK